MRQKIWEMRPRWIVTVCLSALAVETVGTALKGNISHPLPSAMQMATTVTSTSSAAPVLVASFGNAIAEAVYLNVPNSSVLKSDGQTVISSSKAI
jgi:hypothetical protein